MTTPFLTKHRISLTPVSPIHVGCGETYAPTNFVIDTRKNLLYRFEPEDVFVFPSPLWKALSHECTDLHRLARFYLRNLDAIKPKSNVILQVSEYASKQYNDFASIRNPGKQLEIFRAAYEWKESSIAETMMMTPYFPGSSLKGCVATSLMNRLYDGLQKNVIPPFENSPLRHLKIGDLHGDVRTMAYKVPRLYVKSQQVCHNLVALYECFITGQYRVLSGEMTLNACDFRELAGRKNAYMRASDVMKDLHNYGKKVLWDIYRKFPLER